MKPNINISNKALLLPLLVLFILTQSSFIFYNKHFLPHENYYSPQSEIGMENNYRSDFNEELRPWGNHRFKLLKKNELALWNRYSGTGVPFLANNESSTLNPLNIFDSLFSTYTNAETFKFFISLLAASLACFFLLRKFSLSLPLSLLGMIVYIQASYFSLDDPMFMAYHARNFTIINIFFLIKSNFLQEKILASFFTLTTGALLLCGDLHIGGAGFALSLTLFLMNVKEKKDLFKILYFIPPILLALPQILPTLELISLSLRSWSHDEIVTSSSYSYIETFDWLFSRFTYLIFIFPVSFIISILKRHHYLFQFSLIILIALFVTGGGYLYSLLYTLIPWLKHLNISSYYLINPVTILFPLLFPITLSLFLNNKGKVTYNITIALAVILILLQQYDLVKNISNKTANTPNFPTQDCIPLIKDNISQGKILRFKTQAFPPNIPMLFEFEDIHYYDALVLKKYNQYLTKIDPIMALNKGSTDIKIPPFQSSKIFNNPYLWLLSPSIILSSTKFSSPKLQLLTEKPVSCYNGKQKIYIYKSQFPRHQIYTSDHIQEPVNYKNLTPVNFNVISQNNTKLSININNPSLKKYLIFIRTNYPGWEIYSPHKNFVIEEAFSLFQAIEINSKNPGVLMLEFKPKSFMLSFSISLLTLIILLLQVCYSTIRWNH
ncbi:MAG: hypothetical protein HON90_15795 [Halobacteriovoraceae bacterium]|jgi:hypothetical protein|nr:hypothetical protein [Halobacteriovoraceae bacterium]